MVKGVRGSPRENVMVGVVHFGRATEKNLPDSKHYTGVPFWTWYSILADLLSAIGLQFAPQGVRTDFQQSCGLQFVTTGVLIDLENMVFFHGSK